MNACAVFRFCFNVDWGMEESGYKSRNAYQESHRMYVLV